MKAQYKEVAVGIASATVGVAAIGAVHYMFLAQQLPSLPADFLGIPMNVLLPILLGCVSITGAVVAIHKEKSSMLKSILLSGGAAAIGFGVAEYAGWITSAAGLRAARARAPVVQQVVPSYTPSATQYQTKIIGVPIGNGAMVI